MSKKTVTHIGQNISARNTYFLFASLAIAVHLLLLLVFNFNFQAPAHFSATEEIGIEIKLGMPTPIPVTQTKETTPIESPSTSVVPPASAPAIPKAAPKEKPTPVATKPSRTKVASNPATSTAQVQSETAETSQPATASASAPPSPLFDNPKLPYPELARQRGQEGTVTLAIEVDAFGTPLSVRVHRSSGYTLLDNSAVKAIQKWRFTPANLDGKTVQAKLLFPIEFRLEN